MGEEFASVVHVKRADHSYRTALTLAEERVQASNKGAYMLWSFAAGFHEIYAFEARMIINQHEDVFVASKERGYEGPSDVAVN